MGWWGAGTLAVVGPTVGMLDVFCSGVRYYVLLDPCLCFVSFLCLGLCVLCDGAWMG